MVIMVDQPQMSVEDFEKLALIAERDMGVRLEFIFGRLGVKAVADVHHAEVVRWIARRILPTRGELWLNQGLDIKVEAYRNGRARPDGLLAPDDAFTEQDGNWADPEPVLMVLEVTSYDRDTDARDRVEKLAAYGQAGIPVYLLIDRDSCECVVYSDIEDGVYRSIVRSEFGETVELPDPVGVTFDSDRLKSWVR